MNICALLLTLIYVLFRHAHKATYISYNGQNLWNIQPACRYVKFLLWLNILYNWAQPLVLQAEVQTKITVATITTSGWSPDQNSCGMAFYIAIYFLENCSVANTILFISSIWNFNLKSSRLHEQVEQFMLYVYFKKFQLYFLHVDEFLKEAALLSGQDTRHVCICVLLNWFKFAMQTVSCTPPCVLCLSTLIVTWLMVRLIVSI